MEYFELLKLYREPFSNSPDPDLFYPTSAYLEALQKLEIAIRLRRGLNVVLGDVGTGKTTMSRVLLRALEPEGDRFRTHLLLDPGFPSEEEMLWYLLRLLGGTGPNGAGRAALMDSLQHLLLREALDEDRVVVLLIDEGQKLASWGLETLRELLNFESNQCKLLQLVVFGQLELWERLRQMRNLLDRVNLIVRLGPLGLHETRAMVHHRLVLSGMAPDGELFTDKAVRLVHQLTGGHPRKIINLCHHAILKAMMGQRERVTPRSVREAYWEIRDIVGAETKASRRKVWAASASLASVVLGAAAFFIFSMDAIMGTRLGPDSWNQGSPDQEAPGMVQQADSGIVRMQESSGLPDGADIVHEPPEGKSEEPNPQMTATARLIPREDWFRFLPRPIQLDSGMRVVVRKGDTLSSLVERHLGMVLDPESEWMGRFMRANPTVADPNRLSPGEPLVLPPQKVQTTALEVDLLAWFPFEDGAKAWAWNELRLAKEPMLIVAKETWGNKAGFGVFRPAGAGQGKVASGSVEVSSIVQVLARENAYGEGATVEPTGR